MSDLKEYDFQVVRYRNGNPATFFRNKIVYAELHEKAVKRIAQLETELAEARKDTAAIAKLRALRPENMACDYWSRNMGFPVEQIEDILEELDAASEAEKGGAK